MKFNYNDGGRHKYYKAFGVGDCSVRALAISTNMDYKVAYKLMWKFNHGTPRNGVSRRAILEMMKELGYEMVDCDKKGDSVYISDFENKSGIYYILTCNHATTVADGELYDTWDVSKAKLKDMKVVAYYKVG